jgi:hypothetical protein
MISQMSTGSITNFRYQPTSVSISDFKSVLQKNNFFDFDWYKQGQGFNNLFQPQQSNGEDVLIDFATGLMWQIHGSPTKLNFQQAEQWIRQLNEQVWAGKTNWRLPTLEETLTLLKPKKGKHDLFIDPLFDETQWGIWTSDLVAGSKRAWTVSFALGSCQGYGLMNTLFVRAVALP